MIAAVIPTRFHPPELDALLQVLGDDGVNIHVIHSNLYDHAIYRMWNVGTRSARKKGATEIAILNDDITILPGTLPAMAEALRSDERTAVVYPDIRADFSGPHWTGLESTVGTWGADGMTGFCFMFKAELPLPAFDESYGWWYGDDRFESDVRAAGYGVARVTGIPIRHTANGSASRDWERLGPLVMQDRARWEARA
jgi:hypothetical protein